MRIFVPQPSLLALVGPNIRAGWLQRQNATVTVVHCHTPDPARITRTADIVIAAAGVPCMVRGSWLKPGAVVIDVGINAIEVYFLTFLLSIGAPNHS